MNRILFASIVIMGQALCAGAASWKVKPGTTDWTSYDSYSDNDSKPEGEKSLPARGDTVYLSGVDNLVYTLNASSDPESLKLVNGLQCIVPESEGCRFVVNVSDGEPITLNPLVADFGAFGTQTGKGNGTLVKEGAGTLVLGNTATRKDNYIYSYYLNIDVRGGTLKFPQEQSLVHFRARDVNVAEGAALWLMSIANDSESSGSWGFSTLRKLTGTGSVTNTASSAVPRYLCIDKSCEFGGRIGGGVVIYPNAEDVRIDLTGVDSTYLGGGDHIRLSKSGSRVGLRKLMCDRTHAKSGALDQPSSMGLGHQVRGYAKNVGFVYLGEGGESTWMGLNTRYSPFVVDAGAKGGITFEDGRDWTGYYGSSSIRSEMQELVLTGSNTETVVFRPCLKTWADAISQDTSNTWYITKRGTGTWYFETNASSQWRGGFCVEDGKVQYDKMTEIGENGPFGFGTMAQCRYAGPWDPASNVTYQIALGGSTAIPQLDYVGSNIVDNLTRHIGLNTQGAIVATGCKRPKLVGGVENPFGPPRFKMTGVVSAGGAGEKTLYLDSDTNSLPTIANISDGSYGGTVGVTKRGAGNALISGPLTFTGRLKVEKGTLYVNDGAHYRWFKFTPTLTRYAENGSSNNYQTRFAEFALYDKDGNRVNVGMSGEAYTADFKSNSHPYGAGRDYTILAPNQAAIGRYGYVNDFVPLTYDKGNKLSAGAITVSALNSLVSIFDDVAATDANTIFAINNCTQVKETVQYSWLSLFMHVKNTACEVSSYDFAFFQGNQGQNPYSWKFEGSVDGLSWDLLDEQKYYKLESAYDQTSSYNYWSYTNETKSAVGIAAGQVRKGWPVRNAPANAAVSDLSKVTVEVSAGASLVAEGDFTIGKIEVDASGDGVGTIDNFKLAPKGTLTVRNCAKSRASVVLPLAFANVDPSILSNWSLCVNGRNRPAGCILVSDDGKVTIHPTGMLIIVR